jgi:hypothetical protein
MIRSSWRYQKVRSSLDGRSLNAVAPDVPVDPAAISTVRAEAFPQEGPSAWLDRPDAEDVIRRELAAGNIDELNAERARAFSRNGYVVLEGFFAPDRLEKVWQAYEVALSDGRVAVPLEPISTQDAMPGRALNAHQAVPEIGGMLNDPALVDVIRFLLGARVRPFQTIIGHKGSQQREHSDSIHMTTYPLGYLAAAWIAFETIHPDSGPLVYYPGSHRLPYVFSRDVGITPDDFRSSGYRSYHDRYEPAIASLIEQHALAPSWFLPKCGDVLVWHANLVHGGSQRQDVRHSRRALVCHYFADGCLCYHDLASAFASFGS